MSFIDFVKSPAFLLVVVFVLAVLYSVYAKIRDSKAAKKAPAPVKSAPAGISNGELDLIDTDEKTAAVIMAIVSNKSGIPLNRLSFKSIRLMEDK